MSIYYIYIYVCVNMCELRSSQRSNAGVPECAAGGFRETTTRGETETETGVSQALLLPFVESEFARRELASPVSRCEAYVTQVARRRGLRSGSECLLRTCRGFESGLMTFGTSKALVSTSVALVSTSVALVSTSVALVSTMPYGDL